MIYCLREHTNDIQQRAGIIINKEGTDKFLVEIPTNCTFFDIPKGHLTSGESYEEGACREVEEETGLKFKPKDLEYIGTYWYTSKWDPKGTPLVLYFAIKDFELKDCFCTAKFKDKKDGEMKEEVDQYKLCKFGEVSNFEDNFTEILKGVNAFWKIRKERKKSAL